MKVTILSGGAAKGLVEALAPRLLAECGAAIDGSFGAVGAMRDKLRAGAPADLSILTRALIEDLARSGEVIAGTAVDLGGVATAVASRAGSAPVDVSSPGALRAALMAASELYFPDPERATAGIHVMKVLRALGVAGSMASRLRIYPHGAAAMQALAAATSPAPLGITQASEILITPGIVLLGPLPSPHGLVSVYTAGVAAKGAHPALAMAFTSMLSGPEAAVARARAGFEPAFAGRT